MKEACVRFLFIREKVTVLSNWLSGNFQTLCLMFNFYSHFCPWTWRVSIILDFCFGLLKTEQVEALMFFPSSLLNGITYSMKYNEAHSVNNYCCLKKMDGSFTQCKTVRYGLYNLVTLFVRTWSFSSLLSSSMRLRRWEEWLEQWLRESRSCELRSVLHADKLVSIQVKTHTS